MLKNLRDKRDLEKMREETCSDNICQSRIRMEYLFGEGE